MTHDPESSPRERCPDENAFARLLGGELPEPTRTAIEEHVDRCVACSTLLRELGAVLVTDEPDEHLPPIAPAQASSAFEQRYSVLRPLGSGGAGRVYEALDNLLGRRIALKFLRADEGEGSPVVREKLLAEARALARLSHPNVVQIFDVGYGDASVFLAIELIDGQPLGAWLRATPRSLDERLRVIREIGEGLTAAHRAGLLHRDVKPDNVLVAHDGRARLADFGLARTATPNTHSLAGTLLYLAPEVLAGAPASIMSDQYAFALVVHECLYGTHPFAGASLDAIRWAQQRGLPLAPGQTEVPLSLHAVVAKAASPAPFARFPSMDALLAAIDRALAWRSNPHGRAVAIVQVVMSVVYMALFVFVLVVVLTDDTPADPGGGAPSNEDEPLLEGFSILLAVVTLSGWAPLAAIWGALNAWAILRAKPWARSSTLAYAAVSLITCVGTPAGIYALFATLIGEARTRRR